MKKLPPSTPSFLRAFIAVAIVVVSVALWKAGPTSPAASQTPAAAVAPMEAPDYARLSAAGAEGLVVYQETYDRATYAETHTAGPKKDFDWRLACPERAYEGGFRRIGIGALFGLSEWRAEATALALHLEHLLRRWWRAQPVRLWVTGWFGSRNEVRDACDGSPSSSR